jgi:hypothetical protein
LVPPEVHTDVVSEENVIGLPELGVFVLLAETRTARRRRSCLASALKVIAWSSGSTVKDWVTCGAAL